MAIAEEHGLFVIEDAAQAFGAIYKVRCAPVLAHVGAHQLFPSQAPRRVRGRWGRLHRRRELAAKIRSLVVHGQGTDKYNNVRVGLNARLDSLQAAVLIEKMKIYEEEIGLGQEVAPTL
jgi:dTDP-4-amino-4,6-dideoxygalactose transaminase